MPITSGRSTGFLIEHYAGNFPLWLASDQVRFITLNADEALIFYYAFQLAVRAAIKRECNAQPGSSLPAAESDSGPKSSVQPPHAE